jgi:hypothetical protein
VWEYEDAQLRGDENSARRAWADFQRAVRDSGPDLSIAWETLRIVEAAAWADDIDPAVEAVLEWYPKIDTREINDDNERRTDALWFLSACISVLEREASITNPRVQLVDAAMRDVAARAESVLTTFHQDGFRRIRELRDRHVAREAIGASRRSPEAVRHTLPSIPMARAALVALDIHDDEGPLNGLIERLEQLGTTPSLLRLLRARQLVARANLPAAMVELSSAMAASDRLVRKLRPQIHATYGQLLATLNPAEIGAAIAACRIGRRFGLRWWRRVTPADTTLARLLLWQSSESGASPAQRRAHAREAVRLARRRCRSWHRPTADDRIVHNEALVARNRMSAAQTTERERLRWLRSIHATRQPADKARIATAWVAWAVDTDDPYLAAEAYQYLVGLVPLDVASRYTSDAKHRVLAAAQEHTEEAGYWLARTERYREAVLMLEAGRAVGLSQASADSDVTGGEGNDRSMRELDYRDITAAASDGALIYVVAARAGGYALIVVAHHDPQFVELPKLDRDMVTTLLGGIQGELDTRSDRNARDLDPMRTAHIVPDALKALWDNGMRNVLWNSPRGPILTLIPVGLLSLLPIHAAGEPETFGRPSTQAHHTGTYAAIRYAPNARNLLRCRTTAFELATMPAQLLAIDVPDSAGAGNPLKHVARETEEISRHWPSHARVLHRCTWAEFRDTADAYTIWHLACHGFAQPTSIMDSQLAFADRNITLRELQTDLPPGPRRLAVLSACESNLTGQDLPNEVVGLPSALIRIGFAGVIASAWKVDDLATAYLMTMFYQQWCQAGVKPPVALARAQQWLRAATRVDLTALLPDVVPGGDEGRHPYLAPHYWAAFAYTGA